MKETLIKTRKIYSGRAVGFSADRVRLPDGKTVVREYLNHPGAVAVVAHVDPSHIVLVRQYRYPVGSITWEIPAGKLGRRESPRSCVRRELEEETGFKAGRIKHLLSYWPTAAFSDEIIHIFGAWDLTPGAMNPDEDEFIDSKVFDLETALRWVRTGKIKDSKTVIALLYLASTLTLNPSPDLGRGWPRAG